MTTKTKPKIDAVTLNLVNALKQMDDKLNEGSWEYINLGDCQCSDHCPVFGHFIIN